MLYDSLAKLLKERDISWYKLGKDTGISQQTIHNWRIGRNEPGREALNKIAEYLGVSVDYLVSGREEPPQPKEFNNKLDAMKEELRRRPDKRILFDAMDGATEEDIKRVVAIIEALKKESKYK